MKKLCLLLLLQTATLLIFAQGHEPVNHQKDKLEYEEYTIILTPADGPGYGYDIFKGHSLMIHQRRNPFTMSPMGLNNKVDAYKVAKWEVRQLKKALLADRPSLQNQEGKPLPPNALSMQMQAGRTRFNQPISKKVAQELQISLQPSFTPKN